jgi:hypothetical protein
MNKLTEGSNMRWESMRMMLPEHIQALKDLAIEERKINRPILSDDDLISIGNALQEALKEHCPVELSYYKDGFIKNKICYISKLDTVYKRLTVSDMYGMKWQYDFKNIVGVKISNDV